MLVGAEYSLADRSVREYDGVGKLLAGVDSLDLAEGVHQLLTVPLLLVCAPIDCLEHFCLLEVGFRS